ncbi:hypothetical protein [Alsobacter sp. R-9]
MEKLATVVDMSGRSHSTIDQAALPRRSSVIFVCLLLLFGLVAPSSAHAQAIDLGEGGWSVEVVQPDGVFLRTDLRETNRGQVIGAFIVSCERQKIRAVASMRGASGLQSRAVVARGTASIRIGVAASSMRRIMAAADVLENGGFELSDVVVEQGGALLGIVREIASGAKLMTIELHAPRDPRRFEPPRTIRLRVVAAESDEESLLQFQQSCILLQRYRQG